MKVEYHSFFDAVGAEARTALVTAAEHRLYAPGDCIFEERSQPDALYLVLSGDVEIRKHTPQDHIATLSRIGPNDFFGEMGVLDGLGRSAAAYAVEPCRLARIPADVLLHVLETLPGGATVTLFRNISVRLRKSNQDHVQDAFRSERLRLLQAYGESLRHAMACGLDGPADVKLWLDAISIAVNGEFRPRRSPVPVGDIFAELTEQIGPALAARNVALSVTPCQGVVYADRPLLLLALRNLVVNAVDAMHGAAGLLAIDTLWRPSEIEIRLADSGGGIAETDRDRIFSGFFTAGKGCLLGLGLTVSQQIVEAHGGTIALSSTGPEGSAFLLTIPTKPSE